MPPIDVAISAESAAPDSRHRMGLAALIAVMYLTISGGAYGFEDAVRMAGPRLVIMLCLIVPLSLSIPTALMAAELTALMPRQGGFYFWVKEALGPFGGFAEAYLTILYTAVDMAIYPVLFVSYLSFVMPVSATAQVVEAIVLVWGAGILNLMGARPVGNVSIGLTLILLAPFVVLVAFGFPHIIHWRMPAGGVPGGSFVPALGAGLTVVIWNFGGWENLSVVAEEMDRPQRNYLRAVAVVVPLVIAGYLLPLMASLSGAASTAQWRTGWFAEVGRQLGGAPLGIAIALGGLVSAFSVFEAGMLWVSRMPFVLALEGYLPASLKNLSVRTAAPSRAIVICCLAFSVLVPLGFTALVVMDVFFYMTALALEMMALVKLREMYPERGELFCIGGGKLGLYAVALSPLLTWLATFGLALGQNGGAAAFAFAVLLAVTSVPVYVALRRLFGGPTEAVR